MTLLNLMISGFISVATNMMAMEAEVFTGEEGLFRVFVVEVGLFVLVLLCVSEFQVHAFFLYLRCYEKNVFT